MQCDLWLVDFDGPHGSEDAQALLKELRGRLGIKGQEFCVEKRGSVYAVLMSEVLHYQTIRSFCHAWRIGRISVKRTEYLQPEVHFDGV
jgi:hypothetical protein